MNSLELDKKHIWHPFDFTEGKDVKNIVSGNGCYLTDEDGNQYLDCVSSWWVNTFGHANIHITEAIVNQVSKLEHVIFAGFTHPQAIGLVEKLVKWTPPKLEKFFFSDDGSTAVEVALKMALQYWTNKGQSRKTIVAFEGSYHGDTFGSMSLSARGAFNEPFEHLLFDVFFIPVPDANNIIEIKNLLNQLDSGNIAAFIYEPLVQGARGMVMHQPEWLNELLIWFDDKNILKIADEVMTGFGRTGKMFASDYLVVKPDLMCLSKGITGGFLPLGLTVIHREVHQVFMQEDVKKIFLHGHSYTGNPLSCAAANANLSFFEAEDTWSAISNITEIHRKNIPALANHAAVRSARYFGTIAAVEIEKKGMSGYFNDSGKAAYSYFLKKGFLLRPLGNVIIILPPYIITSSELEAIYDCITSYLNSLID